MYLEIDEGFPGHRKTLRLCSLMQNPEAGWYMIRLWTWACRSCPSGDLRGLTPYDLEMAVQYRKLDGACYKAMVESGYVDESNPGEPGEIHGWMEHTGGAIRKMEESAESKKLWRLHRDGKCERHCKWCKTVQGQSKDSPETLKGRGTDKTAQDKTSPGKTRQDQSRQDKRESNSGARAGDPSGVPERGAVPVPPHNEPGKPTARNVLAAFARIRGETCGGKALFFQPTESTVDKAAKWLEAMPVDAVADIEPAMKRACDGVRDGVKSWSDSRMSDPMFLFATIVSRWSSLREELHGCAPKVAEKKAQEPRWGGSDKMVY